MSRPFTIVVNVEDNEAFADAVNKLIIALHNDEVHYGAKVIGVGWGDRIDQAERMYEFLQEHGYDALAIQDGTL